MHRKRPATVSKAAKKSRAGKSEKQNLDVYLGDLWRLRRISVCRLADGLRGQVAAACMGSKKSAFATNLAVGDGQRIQD